MTPPKPLHDESDYTRQWRELRSRMIAVFVTWLGGLFVVPTIISVPLEHAPLLFVS